MDCAKMFGIPFVFPGRLSNYPMTLAIETADFCPLELPALLPLSTVNALELA